MRDHKKSPQKLSLKRGLRYLVAGSSNQELIPKASIPDYLGQTPFERPFFEVTLWSLTRGTTVLVVAASYLRRRGVPQQE